MHYNFKLKHNTITENLPVATSTPRSAQPVVDSGARQNGYHEGKDSEDEAKRLSTSSELTQVSTTDISSHGDELEYEMIDQVALNKNLQRQAREQSQNSVALSDVVLEEASLSSSRGVGKREMAEASFGFPPPIPTSPPPSLEPEGKNEETNSKTAKKYFCLYRYCTSQDCKVEIETGSFHTRCSEVCRV